MEYRNARKECINHCNCHYTSMSLVLEHMFQYNLVIRI